MAQFPVQQTQTPESLVAPAEVLAANRTLLRAIAADNGLPTGTADGTGGYACNKWNQIAIELQALTAAPIINVYWYYAASGIWAIDSGIGANVVAVNDINGQPALTVLYTNTRAASRVYVRMTTPNGATLNAWLESNQ